MHGRGKKRGGYSLDGSLSRDRGGVRPDGQPRV
jgi:hypothetical protein